MGWRSRRRAGNGRRPLPGRVTTGRAGLAGGVALAVALPVTLAVAATGERVAELALGGGSVWLASPGRGIVSLVDGVSERTIGWQPAGNPGDDLAVVQAGSSAYVSNPAQGSLARVDGAALEIGSPVGFGDPGDELIVVRGDERDEATTVVLNPRDRRATAVAPRTLAARAVVEFDVSPGAEQAVLEPRGRLWAIDRDSGELAWLDLTPGRETTGSRRADGPALSPRAQLVLVEGRATVVDPGTGEVSRIEPDGDLTRRSCLELREADDVQLLGAATTEAVYAVVSETGRLVVARPGDRGCGTAVDVGERGDRFGPLAQDSHFVFVPNTTTGETTVVDTRDLTPVASIALAEAGSEVELLAKDGLVFYNVLDTSRAGTLRLGADGRWVAGEAIDKYNPDDPEAGRLGIEQAAPADTPPETDEQPPPQDDSTAPTGASPPQVDTPPAGGPVTPPPALPERPPPAAGAPDQVGAGGGTGGAPAAGGDPGPDPGPEPQARVPVVESLAVESSPLVAGTEAVFVATVSDPSGPWRWSLRDDGGDLGTDSGEGRWPVLLPETVVGGAVTVSLTVGESAPREETFAVDPAVATVTVSLAAQGEVTIAGQTCTTDCSVSVPLGTSINPGARPGFGHVFDGWSADCPAADSCGLTVTGPTSIAADFRAIPVTAEDCLTHDRAELRIEPEGDRWLLTDGPSRMFLLDDELDAQNALAVAQHYQAACYVGRPDAEFQYWSGPSAGAPAVNPEDCIGHDPAALVIRPSGGRWLLTDGFSLLATLDSEADAGRALMVAREHDRSCFVGRRSPPGEIWYWLP